MKKILLVDDQPMLVDMLREFLSIEGYDVTTHTDGLTALRQMLDVRPDLVVTDFSMPGMNGAALLTAMRENAYLGDTPVLVLSGRPEHEISETCDGYAAYLRKPAEPADVLAIIRRLMPAADRQPHYPATPGAMPEERAEKLADAVGKTIGVPMAYSHQPL